MRRFRALQPIADNTMTALFSTARMYMDFVNGFYVGVDTTDLTGTPTITAGSGLAVTGAPSTVNLTSTAFSRWFNATAGTFFVEFLQNTSGGGGFGRALEASDGTTSNFISLFYNTNYTYQVTNATVSQAAIAGTNPGFGAINKAAFRFAANDFQLAFNGALGTADVSGAVPTVSQLTFGNSAAATRELNGFVRRVAYFPTSLGNSTMQSLTS